MALDQCTLERIACSADQGRPKDGGRGTPRLPTRLSEVFRSHDFRLLWAGEGVSLVGDQFFLVALPWLVLRLTGDAFAIGTVIAVAAAPRAFFMLLGGALTDRFSPRSVMLYSNLSRMILVAFLALLTATGLVQLWMLYIFGLLLGFGYALYLPAQSAIIPRLLGTERLQTGNAVIQGTAQLSLLVGPVIAGVLIALLGSEGAAAGAVPDASGLGIVFGFDAASFLASAITLGMIKVSPAGDGETQGDHGNGVFAAIAEGVASVWRDRTLRHYFILIGAVNLCLIGPLSVGIPVLAETKFGHGAIAFGVIVSALGAGALLGVVAAGVLPRPPGRAFPTAMIAFPALMGIGLSLLGVLTSWGPAAAAAFLIGVSEGYLTVEFVTWLQLRTSPDELGRMMGILMFAAVGLAPLSNVAAGVLIRLSVSLVLLSAGLLIILVAVIAALSPSVWRLGDEPTAISGPPDEPDEARGFG
jgi:MFS family permease